MTCPWCDARDAHPHLPFIPTRARLDCALFDVDGNEVAWICAAHGLFQLQETQCE